MRGKGTQSAGTVFEENDEEPKQGSKIDDDWALAVRFYPELSDIGEELRRISWRLMYAFKAYIMETKNFENALPVAKRTEEEFLKLYFGENAVVRDFARHLIFLGNRKAARDLNRAVKLLGENADPGRIISTIRRDHNLPSPLSDSPRTKNEANNENGEDRSSKKHHPTNSSEKPKAQDAYWGSPFTSISPGVSPDFSGNYIDEVALRNYESELRQYRENDEPYFFLPDLNWPDRNGDTRLCMAVCAGDYAETKKLLASGADPTIAGGKGQTPLELLHRSADKPLKNLLRLATNWWQAIPKQQRERFFYPY